MIKINTCELNYGLIIANTHTRGVFHRSIYEDTQFCLQQRKLKINIQMRN